MPEISDKAVLDISDYLKKLHTIDANIAKMAGGADKGFGGVGKSATASGIQIGAVSGVVQELTSRILNMGQSAIKAFAQFSKESVGLASELETTGKVFGGIFQGNEQAAVAVLERIRKESRGLGIDLSETARAFLPFVENLDQLSRVGKLAAGLALSQPEQGEQGARISLQEFLSGNAGSLVKRFEIPKNLGKELNETLATEGVEAGILKLEEIMKRMGRDVDNLGDTFQLSLGKARISTEQLQTAFGVPITDELKSQLDELNKVIEENFDDFEGLATLAGNVIAEIAGAADLSGIAQFFADNEQDIAEFLTALREIVKSAKEFADIDLSKGINVDSLTDAALKIDKIVTALDTLKQITESGDSGGAIAGALTGGLEGVFPLYTAFIEIWENLDRVILAVIGTYGLFVATAAKGQAVLNNAYQEFLALTGQIDEAQKKHIDPQKAYTDSVNETNKAIAEYKAGIQEAADAVDSATIPTKANTEAGEAQANALLEAGAAARALADAQEEAADAQAKIDEARAKAEQDFQQDLLEADIKFERARTDALLDGQRKREDAAQKNLDAIADIEKKNKQAVTDSALDLTRDEQDIFTKHSREKIEQRKEEGQKLLDIQIDTGRKIADIMQRSAIDLDEAAEKRDAVTYLRILKQRNQDITNAQKDAARQVEDTKLAGQRKREELKVQQQQELDDARLANERRLEDLQTALSRELEAQATAYDREREQIATNEQRKLDDLVTARTRDREDAKRHYDEKLADLEISLAAELEIIKQANALAEEEAARHAAAMAEAEKKKPSKTGGKAAGFGENPGTLGQGKGKKPPSYKGGKGAGFGSNPGTITGHAFGGLVNRGQATMVGERGPELFQPSSAGKIIPNNQLILPSMMPKSAINNITNNNQKSASLGGLLDANSLDALLSAKVQNILIHLLDRVS